MKSNIFKTALLMLWLASGASFAAGNDTPATLTIGGEVADYVHSCKLTLHKASVDLTGNTLDLQNQDTQKAYNPQVVTMSVDGGYSCSVAMAQNKVALRYSATADNGMGISIANAATGETAAKGVGIGLYNSAGNLINVSDNSTIVTLPEQSIGLQLVKLNGQTPTSGSVQGTLTIQIDTM